MSTLKHTSTELFSAAFPQSKSFKNAASVLAGGICHDSWHLTPFPVTYVDGRGPTKLAIDGRSLIDLWMGHGSLMLGHAPPKVVCAVKRAAHESSHLAGLIPRQVEWARLVQELVPSADKVRFTSSGTEATLLAMRVARAFTGRRYVLKIDGHFHGWHDEALFGYFDTSRFGLDPRTENSIRIAPPNDRHTVECLLEAGDIAGIILEPGGGSSSTLPFDSEYLNSPP